MFCFPPQVFNTFKKIIESIKFYNKVKGRNLGCVFVYKMDDSFTGKEGVSLGWF